MIFSVLYIHGPWYRLHLPTRLFCENTLVLALSFLTGAEKLLGLDPSNSHILAAFLMIFSKFFWFVNSYIFVIEVWINKGVFLPEAFAYLPQNIGILFSFLLKTSYKVTHRSQGHPDSMMKNPILRYNLWGIVLLNYMHFTKQGIIISSLK